MKTFMTGLLQGRITRWGMLAVLLAAGGLSLAWLDSPQYKLGGGFIGSPARSGGVHWSALQAPLDPAGKTATLRVNTYSFGTDLAYLLALSEADTFTEGIGQLAMISNDTAKGSLVFYGVKQGSLGIPPQVKQIVVWNHGTIKFTTRDTYDVSGELLVYTADADSDGDGRPDPDAVPFAVVPLQLGVTRVLP